MKFEKEALSTEQLVATLVERQMNVGDHTWATSILDSINYYRLATYWYEYRITNASGEHTFRPGTSLAHVHRIYQFDSDLRGLLFRAIESFEVSFRKNFASHLALTYEPFVHLNPTFVKDRGRWANSISRIHSEYHASSEEFARHNKEKYGEYHLPAIWVTVELTTLGGLRHLYQNWANRADRQIIAQKYGLEEAVFDSLIEHLETIRNVCAHHSRLWNKHIAKKPKLPKKLMGTSTGAFNFDSKSLPKIYNTILLLDYVDYFISCKQTLMESVVQLLNLYPEVDRSQMGFPSQTPH